MPRNISFALTTEQVKAHTKTVTRRVGWGFLRVGDVLQPIVKGQGIPKGGKVEKLGGLIRVTHLRREWMSDFHDHAECVREGFQGMTPDEFRSFFLQTHGGYEELRVTRIEFEYL